MHLLHLLPRVPPAVCGVADFAWTLAGELEERQGIRSSFLSAGTSWTDPGTDTRFPVHRLPLLSAHTLDHWLTRQGSGIDAMLLHLSPYGFQKRATPFGLANAWSRLASQVNTSPRLTYFHELFASGPPTTSAFWFQPLQKLVLRRIARASSARVTNRETYARWLDLDSPSPGSQPTEVIPVFSNLGELNAPPPLSARPPDMVVFAAANHSGDPLEAVLQRASVHVRQFDLRRLHVIGGGHNAQAHTDGVERIHHGYLTPEQASNLLSRCRVGYTAYSPDYLGKSGLFASFAAHGLAVITQGQTPHLADGLAHGQNLLNESLLDHAAQPPPLNTLQSLASALHAWYVPHSQRETAARIATTLRSLTRKP